MDPSAQPNGNAQPTVDDRDDVDVRSVEELADKYGFDAPDEWAGPDSSRAVLDYGPPIVLADSSRSRPAPDEPEEVWKSILARHA